MRRTIGFFSAIAAALAFIAHIAAWLGLIPSTQLVVVVSVGGAGLVIASAAASARVLRPHYVIGRVMQLHKLRPFFSWPIYVSICIVFACTAFGLVASISSTASSSREAAWKTFTAVWYGSFYIDAMILLFAKAPKVSTLNEPAA